MEMTVSPAVRAATRAAAIEAVEAKHEKISVGLMLVGLCKMKQVEPSPEVSREADRLHRVLSGHGVNLDKLRETILQLEGTGTADHGIPDRPIDLEPGCWKVVSRAKEIATEFEQETADTRTLLLAILEQGPENIGRALTSIGVDVDGLRQTLVAQLKEKLAEPPVPRHAPTPTLDELGTDLIQQAREGKIKPIIDRREELRQTVRTLMREEKNNPVLVGEPGVGKTVIVKGLAYRIFEGNVIPFLRNKRIVELPISALRSRGGDPIGVLRAIIKEVRDAGDVIVFVDEIHILAEHGVSIRYGFADVMKTALAQGGFPLIGATTTAEYRKYFEEDAAFARRFERVEVGEPSHEVTREILEAVKKSWEEKYCVSVTPDAVRAAIDLTVRYMPRQRLPDKAKSVLEDACIKIYGGGAVFTITGRSLEEAGQLLSGVSAESVAEIVSERIGRDVTKELPEVERQRLETMAETIKRRVVGQDRAVEVVSNAVQAARMRMGDPKRPLGVFLFVGPSGVGKTQLAKTLAEFLFGSEDSLSILDMGQYQTEWTVSHLTGPPPGYVGYDEGGDLTNRLLDRSHAVVLLDEIEKAHPAVYNILLSLFDNGRLEDNHFRVADGRNAIFICTSNLGSDLYREKVHMGFGVPSEAPEVEVTEQQLMQKVEAHFSPEFLGRFKAAGGIVFFDPLTREGAIEIARIVSKQLSDRLAEQGVRLEFDDSAIELLAQEGFSPAYGARELQNVLRRLVEWPLTQELLRAKVQPDDEVLVTAEEGEIAFKTQKQVAEAPSAGG